MANEESDPTVAEPETAERQAIEERPLTPDQLDRIERNRLAAEQRRREREMEGEREREKGKEVEPVKPGGFVPEEDPIALPKRNVAVAGVAEEQLPKDLVCRDCDFPEVDPFMYKHFKLAVCEDCRRTHADRYRLVTKTEAREGWLLTEEELRDEEILPHATRPNPLKSHWSDMQLFWIGHVEAASMRKWGSREAIEEHLRKRERQLDERRERKYDAQLAELRKRTKLSTAAAVRPSRHQHEFEQQQIGETVFSVCRECGFKVEFEE